MVKVLLRFQSKLATEPITSTVVLEKGVKLNILRANIHERGGEMLVEIPDESAAAAIEAFKSKGVEVIVERMIMVNGDKCIHCGECYSLCPVDAIQILNDFTVAFDENKCIGCGICLDACPMRAISMILARRS